MTRNEVVLSEWETATAERWPVLANRRLSPSQAAAKSAKILSESGRLEVRGLADSLELRATSWVGRISLGDLTVTIRPKIPQLPLLSLMRYAYGLRDLKLIGTARFATESWSFQDLLIAQLGAEVSELLARGLHRDFRRAQASLESPRGRIDFGRYATDGGTPRAALACVYHPRTSDTALNRALCSGLRLALLATRDLELRVHLRRLLAEMDLEPAVSELDLASLAGVRNGLDRRTARYSPALVLIGLLLEGQSLSLDAPASELPLEGFLFDMNRFFQALLSRFLREHLVNLTLLEEHQLQGVFSYDPHHNPQNRRAIVPRPDFVVRQGQRSLAVLDAKYRDLWERDLPREMLYQLAIYALTELADHPTATMLYPTLSDQACEQVVMFQNAVSGANKARVVLRPVQLLALDRLLRAGTGIAAVRQRQALAARLVGESRTCAS